MHLNGLQFIFRFYLNLQIIVETFVYNFKVNLKGIIVMVNMYEIKKNALNISKASMKGSKEVRI